LPRSRNVLPIVLALVCSVLVTSTSLTAGEGSTLAGVRPAGEQAIDVERAEQISTVIDLAGATKHALEAVTQALTLAGDINKQSELLLRDLKALREETEQLKARVPFAATMMMAPMLADAPSANIVAENGQPAESAGPSSSCDGPKIDVQSASTSSSEPAGKPAQASSTAAGAPQLAKAVSPPLPPNRPAGLAGINAAVRSHRPSQTHPASETELEATWVR
jgi:hypothetical protein